MILVDTSVWIDRLRKGVAWLALALGRGEVLMHPFVLIELACSNLENRREILRLLGDLPTALMATDAEVLEFIERRALMGQGGWLYRSAPAGLSGAQRQCADLDAR